MLDKWKVTINEAIEACRRYLILVETGKGRRAEEANHAFLMLNNVRELEISTLSSSEQNRQRSRSIFFKEMLRLQVDIEVDLQGTIKYESRIEKRLKDLQADAFRFCEDILKGNIPNLEPMDKIREEFRRLQVEIGFFDET